MSKGPARDRVGQVIGPFEVVADHGRTKRNRRGGRQVIWRLLDHRDGSLHYKRTRDVIQLDREHLAVRDSGGEL